MFCGMGRIVRDSWKRTATRISDDSTLKAMSGRISFAKDEKGTIQMVFMFSLLATVSFVGMTVDFGRGFATKAAIDKALDAAALAGGRKFDATGQMGDATKTARDYFYHVLPKSIHASLDSVKADAKGNITLSARTNIPTMFLGAVGIPSLEIKREVHSFASDVTGSGSKKLEIAIVMDVTGSMAQNSKLVTAKTAAKQLINTLLPAGVPVGKVRISVVPFSEYVNAGSYASAATGVVNGATSTVACQKLDKVCSTVSNAGNGHGSRGGSHGNNGWGNGGDDGHNGSGQGGSTDWGYRSSGGSNNHDDDDDDNDSHNYNASGYNNAGYDRDGFDIHGFDKHDDDKDGYDKDGYNQNGWDRDGYGRDRKDRNGHTRPTGTSAGTHQVCVTQLVQSTCQQTTYVNSCMAERLTASGHAYDDAAPSTALFHAFTTTSASNANCTAPAAAFTPLTSDKVALNAAIDALTPAGYTAGHIGTAWGWYTISDKWASFFPVANRPAPTNADLVSKVVIVMTDGAYNTHYDNNYASVFEDSSNNSTAGNGTSKAQAAAICTNMKASGVQVFTVGLELGSDAASKTALQSCASPANAQIATHYYDVTSAVNTQNGLISVFTDIAIKLASSTGTGNQNTRMTE